MGVSRRILENSNLYYSGDWLNEPLLEMLRRIYPEYENQYVLWLDLNLFTDTESLKTEAVFELLDENGHVLYSCDTSDKNNELNLLLRNPYPNKCITQIGRKCGRKRIYGVPLLFDSYEELIKIKTIRVVWTCYRRIFLTETDTIAFDMYLDQLLVQIDVKFAKPESGECKFYTIHSQDKFFNKVLECISSEKLGSDEDVEAGMLAVLADAGHDVIVACDMNLFPNENMDELLYVPDSDFYFWIEDVKNEQSTKGVQLMSQLQTMGVNQTSLTDLLEHTKLMSKAELNIHRAGYQSSITVPVKSRADILVSGSFGFRT